MSLRDRTATAVGDRRDAIGAEPVFWTAVGLAVASLAVATGWPTPSGLAVASFGLVAIVAIVGVVAGRIRDPHQPLGGELAGPVIIASVFVAGTGILVRTVSLFVTVVAVAGGFALVSYGLYRYHLVSVGILEGNNGE